MMIDVFAKTFMTAAGVASEENQERRKPTPIKADVKQTSTDGLVRSTLVSLGFRRRGF